LNKQEKMTSTLRGVLLLAHQARHAGVAVAEVLELAAAARDGAGGALGLLGAPVDGLGGGVGLGAQLVQAARARRPVLRQHRHAPGARARVARACPRAALALVALEGLRV